MVGPLAPNVFSLKESSLGGYKVPHSTIVDTHARLVILTAYRHSDLSMTTPVNNETADTIKVLILGRNLPAWFTRAGANLRRQWQPILT